MSCVGTDELGVKIREELRVMGVDTNYLLESERHPTGTVQVLLHDKGKPSCQILEDVARDYIPLTDGLKALAENLDAVCFGSLSQSCAVSRETIHTFVQRMPKGALTIFDVNLRQPCFSQEKIEASLRLAPVLKISDEEFPMLAGYFGLQGEVMVQLNRLRELFELKQVVYTRGPDGSLLIGSNEVDDASGLEAVLVVTVGAGDSFTAALCMDLLKRWPHDKINSFANSPHVWPHSSVRKRERPRSSPSVW